MAGSMERHSNGGSSQPALSDVSVTEWRQRSEGIDIFTPTRHSLMLALLNGGQDTGNGLTAPKTRHSLMLALLNGGWRVE